MKLFIFTILTVICFHSPAQYIAVKARYTATRLVDNSPGPPSRENRLVLSFFTINANGDYIPTTLSNYDCYVYAEGLQYGNLMGGVLDSTGNNYPGYNYTAPQVVAYGNSYGLNFIDCNPNIATKFTANGHDLDCGWIRVSYWSNGNESFTAPNVCLPYYPWSHPYSFVPGNVNFYQPLPPSPPYNYYNFTCDGSTQQLVVRGLLQKDTSTSNLASLPVLFADVKGTIDNVDWATISFSNLTESDILQYEVERSTDGINFQPIGTIAPAANNGSKASYLFAGLQPGNKNYYRIKATETNARIFYSTVLSLSKLNKPSTFAVFPNPSTNGLLNIRLSNAEAGRYILSVINSAHQYVKEKLIDHNGGDINRQLDLNGLPRGMYQLVIKSSAVRHSQKIIYVY